MGEFAIELPSKTCVVPVTFTRPEGRSSVASQARLVCATPGIPHRSTHRRLRRRLPLPLQYTGNWGVSTHPSYSPCIAHRVASIGSCSSASCQWSAQPGHGATAPEFHTAGRFGRERLGRFHHPISDGWPRLDGSPFHLLKTMAVWSYQMAGDWSWHECVLTLGSGST
jgi:hypothetical protein